MERWHGSMEFVLFRSVLFCWWILSRSAMIYYNVRCVFHGSFGTLLCQIADYFQQWGTNVSIEWSWQNINAAWHQAENPFKARASNTCKTNRSEHLFKVLLGHEIYNMTLSLSIYRWTLSRLAKNIICGRNGWREDTAEHVILLLLLSNCRACCIVSNRS